MTKLIGGGRALQVCDLCGGVDDHPRHMLGGGDPGQYPAPTAAVVRKVSHAVADLAPADGDRLMALLLDTGGQDRHIDCCRAAGCPTGACDTRPDVRGAELLTALTEGN